MNGMRTQGTAAALEARRLIAADLLQDGMKQADVARHLRVHVSTVGRWKRALDAGGREALGAKPQTAWSKLEAWQKERLIDLLRRGPLAAGFETDLWTCPRVAQLIEDEFGVTYHVDHIGRLLRSLGFTPQKPARRARERDDEAIESWRQNDWPRIKKRAVTSKLPSSFSTKPASCCNR